MLFRRWFALVRVSVPAALLLACAGSNANPENGEGEGGGGGVAAGNEGGDIGAGGEAGSGAAGSGGEAATATGGTGAVTGSGGMAASNGGSGGIRTGGSAAGGTGGTRTGGSGGAGAGGAFMPGQVVRIQPLGDSITQGRRHPDEASYRRPLWKKLKAAGYNVDFVGSTDQQLDGAHYYDDYDHNHEGHYGWKITDVLPQLDGWLKGYSPDVSLIHLGTNDQGSNNPAQMITNIGTIIDKLRAKNPRVVIIVAKLIEPSGVGRQFGDMLPALATQKGTATSPIVVVDQDLGFTSADTRDGIHPNPTGQEKMATKWFDALVKILPAP